MNVSLDTDITIHLYNSGKEELLFRYFDKCYIHEFILEREIKNKSESVYQRIKHEEHLILCIRSLLSCVLRSNLSYNRNDLMRYFFQKVVNWCNYYRDIVYLERGA